jgi:hypothetical protein
VTWLLTILSIIGVVLNIYKKRSCFIIWSFTNGLWAIVDFYYEIYAQAALFTVYFCLAIYGLIKWK